MRILTFVSPRVLQVAPRYWKQVKKDLGRPIAPAAEMPHPERWPDRGLFAAWLGHSTVLLKLDGIIILTDPVFSSRAGLNFGPVTLGIKRLTRPALKLAQLPKIDLVLLSHAHMDHVDLPSLRALENRGTVVITASGTSDLLRRRYQRIEELAWGEQTRAGPVAVRAFEVNHWGARMRNDTWRGYNGYAIESGRYRALFAGDTANTGAFRRLRSSRAFDLAIMPVGAYDPWIRYHCTPEQAWRMGNEAGAEFLLPVHHQTFQLSREPLLEPVERFMAAAGNCPDRIALTRIGQEFWLSR